MNRIPLCMWRGHVSLLLGNLDLIPLCLALCKYEYVCSKNAYAWITGGQEYLSQS